MEFFDRDIVPEVALAHIDQIVALEEAEVIRIMKLYKGVRQELRDRLDLLPKDRFTAQQMRGTLLQIELAIQEMNRILSQEVSTGAQKAAEKSIEHLIKEINLYDKEFTGAITPINIDALRIATETQNFLFNRYEASLKSYGESLRAQFARMITEGIAQEQTSSQLVSDIGKMFMGEEWKLHRIVRTELHNVYNTGKIDGMKEVRDSDLPDLMKTLFHPMDKRTANDSHKLKQKNPIIPIEEPFRFTWGGKERVFMAPPDRPNDRAILIPYRKAWVK